MIETVVRRCVIHLLKLDSGETLCGMNIHDADESKPNTYCTACKRRNTK